MKTVEVQVGLGKRSYGIRIGAGLLGQIGFFLREAGLDGRPWAIISDDQVGKLYAEQVRQALAECAIHVEYLTFPHGEASKRLQTLEMLAEQLVDLGFDRNSGLLALGGGVTGDITGFLASIYMRGIPFVQVPTTLLAQVDSSVGGKTGVDMEQGKNLLGTFYQPLAVFIDTNTLATLPKEEFASGMAEVIKYGVILDADFFAWLDQHADGILALDTACLVEMVRRCCAFKAQVVEEDEREGGFRRVLNFGHTIGHALELLSGYRLSHGHAVAIGMCAAADLSLRSGYASGALVADISALVRRFGLPATIPAEYGKATLRKDLWAALKADKKKQGDRLVFVLPEHIGKVRITDQVQAEDIDAVLSPQAQTCADAPMYAIPTLGSFAHLPKEVLFVLHGDYASLKHCLEKQRLNLNKRFAIGEDSPTFLTLLHVALMVRDTYMVLWLIDQGASVNNRQDPVIFKAAQFGDAKSIQTIIERGGLDNLSEKQRSEIFSWVHAGKNYSILNSLAQHGITIAQYGGALLRQVLLEEEVDLDLLKKLVGMGADINHHHPDAICKKPETPLMLALRWGASHAQAAEWLLDQGADVLFIDPDGERAYSLAKSNRLVEIAKRIKALEPPEWHDASKKEAALRHLACPKDLLTFLAGDHLILRFSPDAIIPFIRFFPLAEVVISKWKRRNIVVLSEEIANYDGMKLVWLAGQKKLAMLDTDCEALYPLASWTDFVRDAEALIQTQVFDA